MQVAADNSIQINKSISLSFSGSGFRFSVFIGVAKAFLDAGYTVVEYSGTSGGAIIAAFLADDYFPLTLLEIAKQVPYFDFVSLNVTSLFNQLGYNDGSSITSWLEKYLGDKTFKDLKYPCTMIATNVTNKSTQVFSNTTTPDVKVSFGCRASLSVPFIYDAVNYNNSVLVDGGLVDNLPVDYLTNPHSIKVAINLTELETPIFTPTFIPLISRLVDMLLEANVESKINSTSCKVITIETPPDLSFNGHLKTSDVQMLFDLGYNKTKQFIQTMENQIK